MNNAIPSCLMLFRTENRILVCRCDSVPRSCRYEGRVYEQLNAGLGDYNHLLDKQNELAGFDFPYADLFCPEIASSRLVTETANTTYQNGMLQILLSEDTELTNDCCQALGGWLYFDGASDHIIVLLDQTDWCPKGRFHGFQAVAEIANSPVILPE